MIDKYHEGFEIVYGVRDNRDSDSVFKRTTANKFYSLMSWLGVNQVPNHADFRLLGRTALSALNKFKEQNVYLRGLIPLLGYKSTNVYYSRDERVAGESKYPLKNALAGAGRNNFPYNYSIAYDRYGWHCYMLNIINCSHLCSH